MNVQSVMGVVELADSLTQLSIYLLIVFEQIHDGAWHHTNAH